ncbi:GDSL Lipase/Acylhydrolase, partial [Piedraia hortae CBS 480.64]
QMDQIVLFGDSLTQQSFSQVSPDGSPPFGFGAALANAYVRRLDVINRGLSGYNTDQALQCLDQCIPNESRARTKLMTILFGSNDCRIAGSPGTPQTVEVDKFRLNLSNICSQFVNGSHRKIRVVLITPPPIDERKLHRCDMEIFPHLRRDELRRTAENTAKYAQVVRDVGRANNIPVLDLWRAFGARAGYAGDDNSMGSMKRPTNAVLQSMFNDGLHLSGAGNKVVFDELMALIEAKFPDLMPEKLPMAQPAWDDKTWEGVQVERPKTVCK